MSAFIPRFCHWLLSRFEQVLTPCRTSVPHLENYVWVGYCICHDFLLKVIETQSKITGIKECICSLIWIIQGYYLQIRLDLGAHQNLILHLLAMYWLHSPGSLFCGWVPAGQTSIISRVIYPSRSCYQKFQDGIVCPWLNWWSKCGELDHWPNLDHVPTTWVSLNHMNLE